ncbi:MAG: hypothetical protein V1826_01770 [bacterium]
MLPLTEFVVLLLLCVGLSNGSAPAERDAGGIHETPGGDTSIAIDPVAIEQLAQTVAVEVAQAAQEIPRLPTALIRPTVLRELAEKGAVTKRYAAKVTLLVNDICWDKHVPVEIGWRMIWQESGGRHYNSRGGVKRGGSGEWGICQILDDGMQLKKGYNYADLSGNLKCGLGLLSFALNDPERKYDERTALGWYNAGKKVSNTKYVRQAMAREFTWEEVSRDEVEQVLERTN